MFKRHVLSYVLFFLPLLSFSQTILQQENFTNYLGTSATVPAGWSFSYNGNYTTVSSCGTSGPNAYKFGVNAATINTPPFSNADLVTFWVKGLATNTISMLVVLESADSISWDTIAKVNPVPTSGTTMSYVVNSLSHHLRFTYIKSAGNVSFDDYVLQENNFAPNSPGSIRVYFNHPVNTNVSTGVNAVYLNQTIDDTLVQYINRAKYTLDIAVYNYIQTSAIASISNAINLAYARGVKIRWIYDGSSSNTGLTQLNAAIPTLPSPTSPAYNIMHNKFMIVDAHSADSTDAIVWTGSTNWDDQQINSDYNNVVIVQDKNLATAYTTEFNEMWGDTGMTPNLVNSKFGPFKTNNTPHAFTIGSRTVELYFSPSDGVNSKIQNAISSADNTLYFGVYTFTETPEADSITFKIQQQNVYAAGIMDQNSTAFSAYTTLNPVMGNMLKVYSGSNLYHNKFLIVDECDSTSDPLVLTGSHNWTVSADTKNDENTLIIHSAIIANEYYQSFDQDFTTMGGVLSPPCVSGVEENYNSTAVVYPNPSSGELFIETDFIGCVMAQLFDETGKSVLEKNKAENGNIVLDISGLPDGIYFLKISNGDKIVTRKIIIAQQ